MAFLHSLFKSVGTNMSSLVYGVVLLDLPSASITRISYAIGTGVSSVRHPSSQSFDETMETETSAPGVGAFTLSYPMRARKRVSSLGLLFDKVHIKC